MMSLSMPDRPTVSIRFSAAQIAGRVDVMAAELAAKLPADTLVVSVLKGSFVFAADLIRALSRAGADWSMDFLTLSSYGTGTETTGRVRVVRDIVDDVRELCPRMAIISNGELLLEGAPSEALDSLVGKIWSKVVATDDELRALEGTFNVISSHLIGGLHDIRVYADSNPGDGFRPVESGLEDVYFLNLASQAKN